MVDASSPAGALMDRVYRRQRHIYDLTRKNFLLGRDQLIAALDPPPGGSVLEIGCGTGRNLIAAARARPDVAYHGIDISSAMLDTARANVVRSGFAGRIRLARADAASFEAGPLFARRWFDRVFFSYSLSMIPPWREALATAAAHVAPGGRLHVVDFGQQEGLPVWFRALLFAWIGRFHVSPRAELQEAIDDVAALQGGDVDFRPLYRGYAWYAELRALPKTAPARELLSA
ncbi:MAG: methyltransferase domain-containing protein [Bauldia sp.]